MLNSDWCNMYLLLPMSSPMPLPLPLPLSLDLLSSSFFLFDF